MVATKAQAKKYCTIKIRSNRQEMCWVARLTYFGTVQN